MVYFIVYTHFYFFCLLYLILNLLQYQAINKKYRRICFYKSIQNSKYIFPFGFCICLVLNKSTQQRIKHAQHNSMQYGPGCEHQSRQNYMFCLWVLCFFRKFTGRYQAHFFKHRTHAMSELNNQYWPYAGASECPRKISFILP